MEKSAQFSVNNYRSDTTINIMTGPVIGYAYRVCLTKRICHVKCEANRIRPPYSQSVSQNRKRTDTLCPIWEHEQKNKNKKFINQNDNYMYTMLERFVVLTKMQKFLIYIPLRLNSFQYHILITQHQTLLISGVTVRHELTLLNLHCLQKPQCCHWRTKS